MGAGDHAVPFQGPSRSIPWLLGDAIHGLAQDGLWCGTPAALLIRLQKRVPKRRQRLQGWPTSAETLAVLAQQLVIPLRKVGVQVTFPLDEDTQRPLIQVAKVESRSTDTAPGEHEDQQRLFAAEDLVECARAAGGKRWR
jgi:hypothetical protein